MIGIPDTEEGQKHLFEVQQLYDWGSWETGVITQGGSEYVRLADCTIIKSLAKAVKKVEFIELTRDEAKLKDDTPLSESLTFKCRGALGSTMFLASQGKT